MKKIFLAIALVAAAATLYANPNDSNEKRSGFDPGRLVFGGNVGFAFGSDDYWALALSPQIGYRLTDKLTVGAGISYTYSQEDISYVGYDYNIRSSKLKKNQFGFNVFGEFHFSQRFFVFAQPEIFYQNRTWKYLDTGGRMRKEKENDFVPAVILGVGVQFRPVILSIGYDIIQDDLSPYGDTAFLSIGFRF